MDRRPVSIPKRPFSIGTVMSWGANKAGQLGDGSTENRDTHVIVRYKDGNPLRDVVAVAAGRLHSVALKRDGTVWGWGANTSGQLGDYTTTNRPYAAPVGMINAQGTQLTDVIAIAAGANHTVALKSDGTVYSWGANGFGQLGNGSKAGRNFPALVLDSRGNALSGIVAIAAGQNHTLALRNDGSVLAWGKNLNRQLGTLKLDTTHPQFVMDSTRKPLTGVMQIAAGANHTVALTNDGRVLSWGGVLGPAWDR